MLISAKGGPLKQIATITLLALSLFGAGSAEALGPVTAYGGVGYSKLSSPDDLKLLYENGSHFTVGLGFSMAPALQIVPKFEYHSFAPDLLGTITKMKVSMYGVDARLSIGPPGFSFKPVLLAGIGLASTEIDISIAGFSARLSPKETDFYYNLGAGLDMHHFTFQVRYVSVSSEGDAISFMPFTIGMKF